MLLRVLGQFFFWHHVNSTWTFRSNSEQSRYFGNIWPLLLQFSFSEVKKQEPVMMKWLRMTKNGSWSSVICYLPLIPPQKYFVLRLVRHCSTVEAVFGLMYYIHTAELWLHPTSVCIDAHTAQKQSDASAGALSVQSASYFQANTAVTSSGITLLLKHQEIYCKLFEKMLTKV